MLCEKCMQSCTATSIATNLVHPSCAAAALASVAHVSSHVLCGIPFARDSCGLLSRRHIQRMALVGMDDESISPSFHHRVCMRHHRDHNSLDASTMASTHAGQHEAFPVAPLIARDRCDDLSGPSRHDGPFLNRWFCLLRSHHLDGSPVTDLHSTSQHLWM